MKERRWKIGFILLMKEDNSRRKRKRNGHAHCRDVTRFCSSKKKNIWFSSSKNKKRKTWIGFRLSSHLTVIDLVHAKKEKKSSSKMEICEIVGPAWSNATDWPDSVQVKKKKIRFDLSKERKKYVEDLSRFKRAHTQQ